jgi:hypothetical protein
MYKNDSGDHVRALVALRDNNLKHFLTDFFSFRLYVSFKPPEKSKKHFYGNEYGQVSLNQVMAGYKSEIVLDKYKGLTNLIDLVEKSWKGKWISAAIYMRAAPGLPFDIIVRRYYQGKLEDENTPVLTEPFLTVYYHGKQEMIPIFKTEPLILPDFKNEIEKSLNPDYAKSNKQALATAARH